MRYLSHCHTLLITNCSVSKIVTLIATEPTLISARTYATATMSLRYVIKRCDVMRIVTVAKDALQIFGVTSVA